MDFQTLTKDQLKTDYIDRWGFVFISPPFHSDKCQLIADTLIQYNITKDQPEFIVELDENTKVFVYPLDCQFDGPTLFQKALILRQMGIQIDILKAYLNNL